MCDGYQLFESKQTPPVKSSNSESGKSGIKKGSFIYILLIVLIIATTWTVLYFIDLLGNVEPPKTLTDMDLRICRAVGVNDSDICWRYIYEQ